MSLRLLAITGACSIGGILAGGVAAIIGGVTGRKDSNHLVHRVDLIIYFDDATQPYRTVNVFSDHEGVKLDDWLFRDKYSRGMQWCKFIEQ